MNGGGETGRGDPDLGSHEKCIGKQENSETRLEGWRNWGVD